MVARQAAVDHSCKYRWLHAPATKSQLSADKRLTIGRSSRGAAAPRLSVRALPSSAWDRIPTHLARMQIPTTWSVQWS